MSEPSLDNEFCKYCQADVYICEGCPLLEES